MPALPAHIGERGCVACGAWAGEKVWVGSARRRCVKVRHVQVETVLSDIQQQRDQRGRQGVGVRRGAPGGRWCVQKGAVRGREPYAMSGLFHPLLLSVIHLLHHHPVRPTWDRN